MQTLPHFDLKTYHYELPPDRIAQEPRSKRTDSKLLVYKNGTIQHSHFHQLASFLNRDTTLVLNDAKVLPARLQFQKPSGAKVEILLVKPSDSSLEVSLKAQQLSRWECMIGNLKRWKDDPLCRTCRVNSKAITLRAILEDRLAKIVRFEWDEADITFAEIIEILGQLPLPPYLDRPNYERDRQNYQTVYAHSEGAVAAPTAGLHFTNELLAELQEANLNLEYLTLWVGLGTFLPLKKSDVLNHKMHAERISVSRQTLLNLINKPKILAVGTTSMRTLETLYWLGLNERHNLHNFYLPQFEPYHYCEALPAPTDVLERLYQRMLDEDIEKIEGETAIFILPSYRFKLCQALITNFHLPESTLLLLIAAFIGEDWKRVYEVALENDYRFLSYGDASLLWSSKFSDH